jgi:hypothetical protein
MVDREFAAIAVPELIRRRRGPDKNSFIDAYA